MPRPANNLDENLELFWNQACYSPRNGTDYYTVYINGKTLGHKDTLRLFEKWLKVKNVGKK